MSSSPPPPFEPSGQTEYAGWLEMIHSVVAFVTASTHLATVLRNNRCSFTENGGLVKVIETITGTNNLEYYSPLDFPWFLDELNNVRSQTKYRKSQAYRVSDVVPLIQYPMFDGIHGEPDREPRTFRLVDTKDFGDINFDRSSQSLSTSNGRNNNSFHSAPSEEKPKPVMKYKNSSDSCFFDEYSDSDQTINSTNLQENFEDFEEETSKANARSSSGSKRKGLLIRSSHNTTTENHKTVLEKSEEVEQYSTVYKANEFNSKHSDNEYSPKNLDNGFLPIYSGEEDQYPVMKSEDSQKGSETYNEEFDNFRKLEYSSKGSQHVNDTNFSDEVNHAKIKSEDFIKGLKHFDEKFENIINKLNHSTGGSRNLNTMDLYMDCTVEDPQPKEVRKGGICTANSYDDKSVTTYVDNIEVILKATQNIDQITSELSSKYGENTQDELSAERAHLNVELTDEKSSSVANFSVEEKLPEAEEKELLPRTHIPSRKAKQRKSISGKSKHPVVTTLSGQKRDYKNKYLGDISSADFETPDEFVKKSIVGKKLEPPTQTQIPKKVYAQSATNKIKAKMSQEGGKLKLRREYGCEVDFITKNIVNCLNITKKCPKIPVDNNKAMRKSVNNSTNSSDKENSAKKSRMLSDTVKDVGKGLNQSVSTKNQTHTSDLKPTEETSLSADTVKPTETNKQTIQQKKQTNPKKPVAKSVSNKERPSSEREPTASNAKSKIAARKLEMKSCLKSGGAPSVQKNCVLSEIIEECSTRPITTTVTSRQERKVPSRQEKKERILPKMTLVRDTTLKLTAAQNVKKASDLLKNVDDILRPVTAVKEKVVTRKR